MEEFNKQESKTQEKNWIKKHPVWSGIIGLIILFFVIGTFTPNEETSKEGLSLSLQKDIYYRLVELQDSIEFDDERYAEKMDASYIVVAEHYNISEGELKEIVAKGLMEEWPMPVYEDTQDTQISSTTTTSQFTQETQIPEQEEEEEQEVCSCSSNIYNCANFSTHAEAQACYEYCGGLDNDIHWLDGDDDGLACEGLP